MILYYPETGRQGILTSTTNVQALDQDFARVEGSKGTIVVSGGAPSVPDRFRVKMHGESGEGKLYEFEKPGRGYFWMADHVAVSIKEGRKEDPLMPWKETMRVMEIMDGVRQRGGARFTVDKW
jgi:predicted dehydrogenase